jgi:hypothetical protein
MNGWFQGGTNDKTLLVRDKNMEISPQDVEFLNFIEEEFTEIEETGFGRLKEANLRILASRLRNILHQKEGSLERLFNIFGKPLAITPSNLPFLFTSHSCDSAAVYAVEFGDVLTESTLAKFSATRVSKGQFALVFPIVGFSRDNVKLDHSRSIDFKSYLLSPLVGIEDVIISRWQVISYLSNKKGIAHYSETRDKKWQKALDKIWNHQVSGTGYEDSIRSLYEMIQRIAYEVLNCEHFESIRSNIRVINKTIK